MTNHDLEGLTESEVKIAKKFYMMGKIEMVQEMYDKVSEYRDNHLNDHHKYPINYGLLLDIRRRLMLFAEHLKKAMVCDNEENE